MRNASILIYFLISLIVLGCVDDSREVNGSLCFDVGTGIRGEYPLRIYSIELQQDNKILIGGSFQFFNEESKNNLVRLNRDGSIDKTFEIGTGPIGDNNDSYGFNGYVYDIKIQSDDKILVGGYFYEYNGEECVSIIRLNSNGSKDDSFSSGIDFYNVFSLAIQPDKKILVGGGNSITRLNSDGSVDNTFNSGVMGTIYSIVVQSDNKILVGGGFDSVNGIESETTVIRFNEDGSVDNTFNFDHQTINDPFSSVELVTSIVIQPNGKILVGGNFNYVNGESRKGIVRLNNDGSIDNSFNSGTGLNNIPVTIKIQDDGKILVCGWFTDYNGASSDYIVRLNIDGSIDNSFETFDSDFVVESLAIESDGKILVSGLLPTEIVRLNNDGSICE